MEPSTNRTGGALHTELIGAARAIGYRDVERIGRGRLG
jgi:hypothetical protein